MACYFFRSKKPLEWEFDIPLTAQIPYSISLNMIRIKFLYEDVPPSQTLYALNGTMVSLVQDTTHYQRESSETNVNLIPYISNNYRFKSSHFNFH